MTCSTSPACTFSSFFHIAEAVIPGIVYSCTKKKKGQPGATANTATRNKQTLIFSHTTNYTGYSMLKQHTRCVNEIHNGIGRHRTKATLLLYEFSRELLPRKHASDKGRITLSEARAYQSQPTPPLSPGDTDERKSVRGMHVPSSSGSGDEVELGLFAPRAHGGHMGESPSKGRADIISGLCSQRRLPSGREIGGTVPQQARKSDTSRRHIPFTSFRHFGSSIQRVGVF